MPRLVECVDCGHICDEDDQDTKPYTGTDPSVTYPEWVKICVCPECGCDEYYEL